MTYVLSTMGVSKESVSKFFPHLLTLNTKRKKVKPEGIDYLQKIHHNWTKANELQRPCFKQDT